MLQKRNTNCNNNGSKLDELQWLQQEVPGYSADWYCTNISSQSSCLDPPLLPCLKPRMEVLHGQESFLKPCLAQRKPQSLHNLGSIITQTSNNKYVTASFSPLKSSWVTFAWGYFIYFLSFPSPLYSPPSPLLLQTTLSCAPAGVWCWITTSFQTDTEPEPEATANSVVQVLKVPLQSERNKKVALFLQMRHGMYVGFPAKPQQK